jgi:hypothetical protein
VISLLTDRERVAADIAAWAEAAKKAEHALADVQRRERELHDRLAGLEAREAAAARRESEIAEREQVLRHGAQRVAEATAALKEMRAEVRKSLAAA